MTRTRLIASFSLLAYTLLHGCVVEGADGDGADDDMLTADFLDGKADGIADLAAPLMFANKASGFVGGDQLDLYVVDLRIGDRIAIDQKVLSGNLAPGFTLFFGVNESVRSASYRTTATTLHKEYTIAATGRHLVAVKAYRGRGEGRYELLLSCSAGPCHGDPPPVAPLTVGQKAACVFTARACALDAARATRPTRLSATRARSFFDGCLNRGQVDGRACANACDATTSDDLDGRPLCDAAVSQVSFYATRSDACRGTFDSCYASCAELGGDGEADAVWKTTQSICIATGYNGNCHDYASALTTCGGRTRPDGTAACNRLCRATQGAWTDDLDTLCSEGCD